MKTISPSKLTTLAMTTGGEKEITRIIDEGILKEWIGFGWIKIRRATKEDRAKYPKVRW